MLASLHLIAGLSWDPAIKGILTVAVGVAILMGSVYLIVATNTGARLGMLLSLGSLFGFLSILTLYWWITPPGIGPRGTDPSWHPVEIFIHEPNAGPAKTEVLNTLVAKYGDPKNLPSAEKIIADHPELVSQLVSKPENTSLSDLVTIAQAKDILNQYGVYWNKADSSDNLLNGWRVISTSQAGEAQAAADVALKDAGLFKDATEYKKLNAFEIGGPPTREDQCPGNGEDVEATHNVIPQDAWCRFVARLEKTFQLEFLTDARYQVIQVQQVIPQEAQPGEPPPVPTVDPTKPVISVVLVRDKGNVRAKPAYFFVICFSLFVTFVLILHYRDKTLQQHLEEAKATSKKA